VLVCHPQAQAQDKSAAHKRYAFQIQDNSFAYEYIPAMRAPFNDTVDSAGTKASNTMAHLVDYTHFDMGYKLGDNVIDLSYFIDSRSEPVSPYFYNNDNTGDKPFYATVRHNFVLNRLFNTDKFAFGPIRDVFITVGADYGSNNNTFGNQRRSPMVGPGVSFKINHGGFWNLSAMWTKEWNHEGTDITAWGYDVTTASGALFDGNGLKPISYGRSVVYDATYTIQTSWGYPFSIASKLPMYFTGWGVMNGTKGYASKSMIPYTGGTFYGNAIPAEYTMAGTKPEYILKPSLRYNFGSLFGPGHNWQVGVGYYYWLNVYGIDHHIHPDTVYEIVNDAGAKIGSTSPAAYNMPGIESGAQQNTPFAELVLHF
jgi:hypothetical protein